MADDITWDAPKEDTISWDSEPSEPADHGLSERQKLSPLGKAASPITSLGETYGHMNKEARNQMSRGVQQLAHPQGALDPLWGAGNVGFGGLNFIASPINAAFRSIIGQPVEDTTGIPREYTEFASQLASPGLGFTKMPKAPGAIPEPMPRIRTEPPPNETQRLGDEFGIKYSRGQSEADIDRIRYEDMAARGAHGPEAQARAADFFNQQYEQVRRAGRGVGEQFGHGEQPLGSPADAGASLNTEVADRAAQARQETATTLQSAERDAAALRTQAGERAQQLTDQITGTHPAIENPREAGEIVGQNVRDAAAANRRDFNRRYDEFGRLEGEIDADAVRTLGPRIREDISSGERPVIIDDHLTPAASQAIRAIDEMSAPRIQNRASPGSMTPAGDDAVIAGVNLQGVDRIRRHLVAYYKAAQRGSEDARAVQAVIHSYDGQIERAISEGLFSGDPRALEALQSARASYSRYQRTFRPQGAGDDVGIAMRRIVERNATPEETANLVLGSGKIGQAGLPVRIADRLEQVLGNTSDAWGAIRQAMWQKASQVRNAAGEVDGARSARNITDFANSTLGRRMFAPEELTAMRNHARGVQELDAAIENLPSAAVARRSQAAYEEAFGGADLTGTQRGVFQRMAEGRATPEETANAMFSVIGAGNPGNAVRALQGIRRVVGEDSPAMGAIRQGIWQKLTTHAFGKDQPGQQKLVQSINEFLNGKGRMIARELYTPEERALMDRYSDAVRQTIIPKYARTNSDTAPALLHAVRKYGAQIASAIGVGVHGGVSGGLEGYAVGKLIDSAAKKVGTAKNMRKLNDSLDNIMPTDKPRRQLPNPVGAARAIPFAGITTPKRRDNQQNPYAAP